MLQVKLSEYHNYILVITLLKHKIRNINGEKTNTNKRFNFF